MFICGNLRRRRIPGDVPQLGDKRIREISLLTPQVEEVDNLLLVLGAIREGGSALDERRQKRFQLSREAVFSLADTDMVQHIIQQIQDMQSLPFR